MARSTQLSLTKLAVRVLQDLAQENSLLGADERLVYVAPDRKAGTGASLGVFSGEYNRPRPFWLPALMPKDTNRTVERLVDAAGNTLYCLNLLTRFNREIDAEDDADELQRTFDELRKVEESLGIDN